MELFVLFETFKALNVGIAIDEGLAPPDDIVPLFYGERNIFWVNFHCFATCLKIKPLQDYFYEKPFAGNPGHGSQFIKNTAAEKVQFMINKLLSYRV